MRTGDIDQDMRVRLDSVARYLQDIANDKRRRRGLRQDRSVLDRAPHHHRRHPTVLLAGNGLRGALVRRLDAVGQHARDHGCEARDQPVQPGPT